MPIVGLGQSAAFQECTVLIRDAHEGNAVDLVVGHQEENAMRRITDFGSAVQNRFEHRLRVSRGAADDSQHFAGSGLALQCIFNFDGSLVDLSEETRVVDSDDCLVGEGGQQVEVCFVEKPYLVPEDGNDPNRLADLDIDDTQQVLVGEMAAQDPCAAGNPLPLGAAEYQALFSRAVAGELSWGS